MKEQVEEWIKAWKPRGNLNTGLDALKWFTALCVAEEIRDLNLKEMAELIIEGLPALPNDLNKLLEEGGYLDDDDYDLVEELNLFYFEKEEK